MFEDRSILLKDFFEFESVFKQIILKENVFIINYSTSSNDYIAQ